jgi:UDP-N-acetylglucosamine 1-carboxyvinyltransferase
LGKFIIEGGRALKGSVPVSGAKNAAVALIPAAIMADDDVCTLDNLPDISDVKVALK